MHPIDLAAFWPGYDVVACSHSVEKNLTLSLEPRATDLPRCGRCQQPCPLIHDRRIRLVRDRDLFDQRVQLRLPVRRVDCLTCGRVTELISWLAPASRLTHRLCSWIEALLQFMTISHVSRLTGLHWHTIKMLDKRRLQAAFGGFEPGDVRRLVMDEFALHKGHRYATVIMDAERTRVLWVGLGNSRKAIRPFFEQLGKHCQQIEAVAMDMNTAYDLEVRQHCPKARVIYDLFHVVAKYGREVIDRVRVDEANRLRHDKPARKIIKQARWLLLRNPENLKKPEQQVHLQDLLAANQSLMTVYLMKAELKMLWAPSDAWDWRSAWKQWLRHAQESEIPALIQFAKRLKGYWRGIVSRVRWPMHTGQLEGINNRIKVIKRMAYGYRDSEFFFMKIKSVFPGNP